MGEGALDLRAGHGQAVLELLEPEAGVDVVVEPEDREEHG
jgi:hypothetical protein